MKIVINGCFGGFSLSEAAVLAYAARKGISIWIEKGTRSWGNTYWTVPNPPKRPENFYDLSIEERQAYNDAYRAASFNDREIARNDPDLVAVVEELGRAASGSLASLYVVEIPDDVDWEIEEYDGVEHVAEKHRTWS